MDSSEQQTNPTQPSETQGNPPEPRLSVIGLGASAGGLAALSAFLDAMPADTGMTFVVVMHLSPEHESVLARLLQPHTQMPVQQVVEPVTMQPNHVYVTPPGKRLLVSEERLELTDFDTPRGRALHIDTFFRSLAEHHGDGGALIFSGTGSDGAVGIQTIKEGGGLILVQDPAEAEFDGMPKSAIATGLVDIVAPVAELAAKLVAAKRTRTELTLPTDPDDLSGAAEQTLAQILAHLRVRTGHDFNGYKRGTLLRRIGRRMQISQVETLTAYLHRLRADGQEVDALFRDILVHVTEFFRDVKAWETLAREVVPHLFATDGTPKGRDDTVRVWTVGCATGEEAYSIGMLLLEYASTLASPPRIQVFASDLDAPVLNYARSGFYPQAIAASISPERLERFFTQENSHYRVKQELRELVIFTPHNLLQDPPFSRLDLILCRNLLIYLQRQMQERAYTSFYYALRPAGYLFLGSAETAEGVSELFETVHKSHRLYRRRLLRDARGHPRLVLPQLEGNHPTPLSARTASSPAAAPNPAAIQRTSSALPPHSSEEDGASAHRLLLEEIAPPSLLIDEEYNVVHISETAGRYLHHPGGVIVSDVIRLVRPELQDDLRAALANALLSGRMARSRSVPVQFNGTPHPVFVIVHPSARSGYMLIFFVEDNLSDAVESQDLQEPSAAEPSPANAELRLTQQRMQSLQEEYETTVEELQSTNEEYRATTEELETSKEELQSINEELHTVNQELRNRVEQTAQAHSDLQNLFIATEIATLFLDRDLRIQRYTPAAADIFNLMPPDQGRPITHLRSNLAYPELEDHARRVLRTLVPMTCDVQSEDDRWFQVDLRPYRTVEDRIDGMVLTFVDITHNKEMELALRDAKEYAESIVHTIPDALLVLETDLCVRTANDTFYEMFNVNANSTEGKLIYDLGNGQWDIPELRILLEEILPDNKVFIGYEVDHLFEGIGRRTMLLNGRRLDHVQLILLAITDITERKRAEEALRKSEKLYRTLFEGIDEGACLFERLPLRPDGLRDYRYLAMNPAMQTMFGIPDLSGQSIRDNFPDEVEDWYDDYDRVLETGEPIRFERRSDPQGMVLEMFVTRVEDDSGQRLLAVMQDVTRRKQAEQTLRQNEERQRFLLKLADGLRPLTDTVAIQVEACRLLGEHLNVDRAYYVEVDEKAGQASVYHNYLRGDSPSLVGAFPLAEVGWTVPYLRRGEPVIVEDTQTADIVPDADRGWMADLQMHAHISMPIIKQGELMGALCVTEPTPRVWTEIDVELIHETAERIWAAIVRLAAETALREAQASLEIALSAAHMGVWDFDLATNQARTDLRHNRLFGFTEPVKEWNTTLYLAHILPEDRSKFEAAYAQAFETGELNVEVRVRWPDGSIHWVYDRGRVYRNEAGEPVRIVGVSVETTERKEAQQAEMRQRIIRGQEAERTHLAREIHDGPVQLLTALTFRLAVLSSAMATESERAELDTISTEIGAIIRSLRNVMVSLRPPAVPEFGLRSALESHVGELRQDYDTFDAELPAFVLDLDESLPDLPEEVTLALYRIAQQALYNTLQHAHAKMVWVRLQWQKDGPDASLVLEIEDDGEGFKVPVQWAELAQRRHLGIVGMIERAQSIDGTVEVQSTPGQGTLVRVRVPLPQP